MRIYTEVIFDMNTINSNGKMNEISSESYEYNGDLALCVSINQRQRWKYDGTMVRDGVNVYKYWRVNVWGKNKKRILTLNKPVFEPTGTSEYSEQDNWGNIPPEFNDKWSMIEGNSFGGAGFDEAMNDRKEFREAFINEVGGKAKEFYEAYGKGSVLPDSTELKTIKNESTAAEWKTFLKYGMGVRDDKIQYYTEGKGKFEDLTTLSSDELEEWSKSEDVGEWFQSEAEDTEEEEAFDREHIAKKLKGEEQIISEGDPRKAKLDEWLGGGDISQDEYNKLLDTLGTAGTEAGSTSILGKEFAARTEYREKYEGAGGYLDELENLYSDQLEEMETLGISKDDALNELLKGYLGETSGVQEAYGQQISDVREEEKELQAKTGLTRETESISDITKTYLPDFQERIKGYQEATGKTQADIMEKVRQAQTAYETGVGEEETSLGFARTNLENILGGGAGFGGSYLDSLTGKYWDELRTSLGGMQEDDPDAFYTWYGENE